LEKLDKKLGKLDKKLGKICKKFGGLTPVVFSRNDSAKFPGPAERRAEPEHRNNLTKSGIFLPKSLHKSAAA
jgi:hypothetical protein